MWKKIALLFVVFCTCSFSYCIEFDPAACPDLSVKIFPGNNKQSVLLVTASGYAPKGNGQFFVVWKSIDWSRKTENGITAFRYMTGKLWGIFPIDEYFYLTKVE